MGTREREIIVELFTMFLQVWQTSSDDDAPKTVRNEAYFTETAPWTVLVDVVVDFLSQSHAHFLDVALCVLFIGIRTEEHSLWKQ